MRQVLASSAFIARRARSALFDEVKAGLRGQPRAAAVTLMAAIPLPAALEQLGCDEATWSEIRGKEAFVTESARALCYYSSRQIQKVC